MKDICFCDTKALQNENYINRLNDLQSVSLSEIINRCMLEK